MLYERLPKQTLYAKVSGRRPVGRSRTRWLDYIEDLGWNRLGFFFQTKCSLRWLIERCGGLIWSCCPRNPLGKASEEKKNNNNLLEQNDNAVTDEKAISQQKTVRHIKTNKISIVNSQEKYGSNTKKK